MYRSNMGILDGIAKRLGYLKARPGYPEWFRSVGESEKWAIPDGSIVANQARLYQKLSWVNIAVSAVAKAAAVVPYDVKKLEGEKRVDIPNHAFERLLERPNPLSSRFQLLRDTFSYFSLTGNAYWYINRVSGEDEPIEIWVVPPNMVQPVPDGTMGLKGYVFRNELGREMALETSEIVHFKDFSPLSLFVGMSQIEPVAVEAAADMKMSRWNASLYGDHNGRIPGIMAFADPIDDMEWEKLKRDTKQASKERSIMMLRNAGKGGVEWIPIAISQKEMEYLAVRDFTKEEIFAVFAPGLAGMLSVSATEANALAARETFNEMAVWPLLEMAGQQISNDLLPVYGDVVGEFKDVRVKRRQLDLDDQKVYSETHTIDEVRERYYGDEALADGRGALFPSEVIKKAAQQVVSTGSTQGTAAEGQRQEGVVSQNTPNPQPLPDAGRGESKSTPLCPPIFQSENGGKEEMGRWLRKAIKAVEAGKSADVGFVTEEIEAEVQAEIHKALSGCKSVEEVREVFKSAPSSPPPFRQEREIGEVIQALREAKAALLEVEG